MVVNERGGASAGESPLVLFLREGRFRGPKECGPKDELEHPGRNQLQVTNLLNKLAATLLALALLWLWEMR